MGSEIRRTDAVAATEPLFPQPNHSRCKLQNYRDNLEAQPALLSEPDTLWNASQTPRLEMRAAPARVTPTPPRSAATTLPERAAVAATSVGELTDRRVEVSVAGMARAWRATLGPPGEDSLWPGAGAFDTRAVNLAGYASNQVLLKLAAATRRQFGARAHGFVVPAEVWEASYRQVTGLCAEDMAHRTLFVAKQDPEVVQFDEHRGGLTPRYIQLGLEAGHDTHVRFIPRNKWPTYKDGTEVVAALDVRTKGEEDVQFTDYKADPQLRAKSAKDNRFKLYEMRNAEVPGTQIFVLKDMRGLSGEFLEGFLALVGAAEVRELHGMRLSDGTFLTAARPRKWGVTLGFGVAGTVRSFPNGRVQKDEPDTPEIRFFNTHHKKW